MPCFHRMRPQGAPELISIYKPLVTFGSLETCDVRVEGEGVLEVHAQLIFDGKDFAIAEAVRGGKITVNGKRKRRSKIFHQDRIDIGGQEFVFSVFDEGGTGTSNLGEEAELQAELRGMRKLADFNRLMMKVQSVENQLHALLDAVIELCHADKGFVVLFEDGETTITAARGVAKINLPRSVEQLSDSIIAKVVATKQPLIVSDALKDETFRHAESVMNLKLSSVMCVPLLAQGDLLGLIYVGNNKVVSLFERSNLDVLTIFAGQTSVLLQNGILLDQLISDRDQLSAELEDRRFGDIIGSCPSLLEVFRQVGKVAGTDISVLIGGETGTGKELVAREVHRRSARKDGPFVVVNCGAIPENLIESELFGHVRGAFTGAVATRIGKFQAASGGTLFLDEVGELPLAMQVKLLRALQEKVVTKVGDTKPEAVDIRIVSATNRDLRVEAKAGNFREDLFYRLNVVNLDLPPLRARGEDIVVIAKYFLSKYASEYAKPIRGLDAAALSAMKKYEWPGNVRQLENRIKKAVVLCEGALLTAADLDLRDDDLQRIVPMATAREAFQRQYVLEVLERNNGNRTKTAKDLDVDPRTIFRYLERAPREAG